MVNSIYSLFNKNAIEITLLIERSRRGHLIRNYINNIIKNNLDFLRYYLKTPKTSKRHDNITPSKTSYQDIHKE